MTQPESGLVKEIKKLYNEKYQGLSGDEVAVYLLEQLQKGIERLDKGTSRLNRLTIALIFLTVILAVLAVIQICS
ncbi:hypothetical protein ACFLW8_01755 [Chloroflexota bacterium]